MKKSMEIEMPDEEIKKYAIEHLGLIEPGDVDDEKFIARLKIKAADDIDEIMDAITDVVSSDVIQYMQDQWEMLTQDDVESNWHDYISDDDVEEYARSELNMMNEEDAAEWAKDKLDS